ncbi:uncharacterized protein LOC129722343 isoform X2 [Wyeomyia smithii]|nr:uncharacterized protein LOC129722343 isoform X2 [Wyeomyia smithii]XP_055531691.1 uncharacterized protein LOC129722343 isoform X2 [Wyeomyia smithii]
MLIVKDCRNISLNHWDNPDYDDDDDGDDPASSDRRENEEIVNLKYLFEPCPEANIEKLLVGLESCIETIILKSSFESSRMILENRIPKMANLRELDLVLWNLYRYPSIDRSKWYIHHEQLQRLKIFLEVTKPYDVMLPHLTTLDLAPNCRYGFHIIEKYCMQLKHLKVQFADPETMHDMISLSFPMLTHLEAIMAEDKEIQERYARTRNKYIDKEKEENFIKSMPKLKSLSMESNLMLYRIGAALSKYSQQLEEITLAGMHIDPAQLQLIEALSKVKTFTLRYTKIECPPLALPKLNMPRLQHLSLSHNDSDIVFNDGLSGLKSLKLTVGSERSEKVLYKICNNLPNLERLELLVYSKWKNFAFRHLNKLLKLRLLRISECDSNINWTLCPVVPNLQRVVFDNCTNLSTKTFRRLSNLFPGLIGISINDCCAICSDEDDTCTSSKKKTPKFDESEQAQRMCREQLESMFPQCIVSLNKTSLKWKRWN